MNEKERQYRDTVQETTGMECGKVLRPGLLEQLEGERDRCISLASDLNRAIEVVKRNPDMPDIFHAIRRYL